jgi:hypothetical protein
MLTRPTAMAQKQTCGKANDPNLAWNQLMTLDLETWLIDTGDVVLQKLNNEGASSLGPTEWGVYWMWWIDYAVRNAGSFGPLQDMDSTAINDLLAFSERTGLQKLKAWLNSAADESAFCQSYFEHFDEACSELRDLYCSEIR